MKNPLFKKYLNESWLLFVALALGVFAFGWFRVWIVGELDTAQFRQIIDLLPKDWRKFASVDFDWLVSYLGRTSTGFDEPMLISLVCGWALIRGSDVVSGELGRGTMEMLLAQPVSRRSVFLRHAFYTILGLVGLVLVLWLGMAIGVWTASVKETTYPALRIPIVDYSIPLRFLKPSTETSAMADYVNPIMFFPGVANLFCVGVFFAGFASLCSSMDRYRWRSIGIVVGFYFANAGMKVVGMGSERFDWVENCCIFGLYHPAGSIERFQAVPESMLWFFRYQPNGEIASLGWLANCLIPLALAGAMYWIGLRIFERRDLPAPV